MMSSSSFLRRSDGLVTIEWVAIAAVCLVAAITIANLVLTGAGALGGAVADEMAEAADEVSS